MRVILLMLFFSSLLDDGDMAPLADEGSESVTFGPEGLYMQQSYH